MSSSIQYTIALDLVGGPEIKSSRSIPVEAYDSIKVVVEPTTPTAVEIQPGTTSGQVKVLAIVSDHYDASLTYTVNSGATQIPLDQPHVYAGQGVFVLLDAAGPPTQLTFTNGLSEAVNIEILAGRDATS